MTDSLVTAYSPELWYDFFVKVGGAVAALTGLVFVAVEATPSNLPTRSRRPTS